MGVEGELEGLEGVQLQEFGVSRQELELGGIGCSCPAGFGGMSLRGSRFDGRVPRESTARDSVSRKRCRAWSINC